jgi:hypothetical protein
MAFSDPNIDFIYTIYRIMAAQAIFYGIMICTALMAASSLSYVCLCQYFDNLLTNSLQKKGAQKLST